jgi:hypothetical protein
MHHQTFREPSYVLTKDLIQTNGIILISVVFYAAHLNEHKCIHVFRFVAPIDCQTRRELCVLILGYLNFIRIAIPSLDERESLVFERSTALIPDLNNFCSCRLLRLVAFTHSALRGSLTSR